MNSGGHAWLDAVIALGGILVGLGGPASLVGAAILLYKARTERRKLSADTELVEAETMEKYQAIADRAADRALRLDERVKQLEETVRQQQIVIETLQCENAALRADIDEFDKVLVGAHVLHDQVIELKGEPKYKPPARRNR
ncbi:MAG: hypothetical protein ACOYYS_19815 [Chloroflexota bacterium]